MCGSNFLNFFGEFEFRVVRAMNETLKRNRLPREQCTNEKDEHSDLEGSVWSTFLSLVLF